MSAAWLDELERRGTYDKAELVALKLPTTEGRESSWAPSPHELAGPLTQVALSDGEVVAGVELWQNLRDRYWFLEGLIRNQDDKFRGAGRDVVAMALAWLADVLPNSGRRYGVRVHAMAKETDAVAWWTRYLRRGPDLDTAYMKTADFFFPAFGWILVPTP
jgi:hypothetical protein